ncbi:MAG TPA: carboxypeptidase regulatory-like domain-containing protein, partial [Candidatus Polarisedimenticolia bacterium]|nr:carboxypeptidase regulatory-like domain-containing protein [Candidatus Polarisedimenticolia bacterium]
ASAIGFEGTAIFTATGTPSPADEIVVDSGNDQIGVISEPLALPLVAVVVDSGNNRIGGVPVTFTVIEGGGSFNGASSFTVGTDSDGRAAATLTLGPLEGTDNNRVEATFPGNPGLPAVFTASGQAAGDPAQTAISGVVLDDTDAPIPGLTVSAVLASTLNRNRSDVPEARAVRTDAEGRFSIPGAPVGFVKLLVDGSTARLSRQYATVEYNLVTVAGRNNTVGKPIHLPSLNTDDQLCVTETTGGGTLTLPEAPGFSLTFGPGQVTFAGGSASGCVGVTVVPGDKMPMAPGSGRQPRFIVMIQPAGAIFNPPAAITLPNVEGLAPRTVTEIYALDDNGSFVSIGTGVVSDDGLVIRSSPGVGVLEAGWHGGGTPVGSGTGKE